MAKVHWRSCILAALFIHGGALVPQAAGSDEEVPPLRHKERMRGVFISLMDTMIAPVPYFSSIPINRPFTAIGLAVRGRSSPDAEVLAEYARRAMAVRLEELGVSEQIQIILSLDAGSPGFPPVDIPYCDMLSVTFSFNAGAHDVDDRHVFVIAADMVAMQPASEERAPGDWHCLKDIPAPDGMMQVGPRVAVVPGEDERAAIQQSQALILSFIDSQIVPRIVRTNKTATETFKSWARDGTE